MGGNGQPVSTYDQNTVRQVALALTGWVYKNNAYEDFTGPMVPSAVNHDTSAKSFLGAAFRQASRFSRSWTVSSTASCSTRTRRRSSRPA